VRLTVGSEGDDVRQVQQALANLGYAVGEVDGVYGATTEAAVIAFQGAEGLTADGIVGAETLEALASALASG
jgi:N-acetylmuramoyl-L-alanine amidase